MDIYTDGSYINGVAKWAFIAVENDKEIYSASGSITDPVINEGYQIGGEIQAVVEAVKYGKSVDKKVKIFFDYTGLKNWIADIWGGKAWKTNKEYTRLYRDFMLENQEWIEDLVKVEAHTGVKWNEAVDRLAAKVK